MDFEKKIKNNDMFCLEKDTDFMLLYESVKEKKPNLQLIDTDNFNLLMNHVAQIARVVNDAPENESELLKASDVINLSSMGVRLTGTFDGQNSVLVIPFDIMDKQFSDYEKLGYSSTPEEIREVKKKGGHFYMVFLLVESKSMPGSYSTFNFEFNSLALKTQKEWEPFFLESKEEIRRVLRTKEREQKLFEPEKIGEPESIEEVSAERTFNPTIRISAHAEQQKFLIPKDISPNLFPEFFDDESGKMTLEPPEAYFVGLDLSPAQERALFAVQTLFHKTGYTTDPESGRQIYKGNVPAVSVKDKDFKYIGMMPRIHFTKAEFLSVYGVTQYEDKNGKMKYSGKGEKEALEALNQLIHKWCVIRYNRKSFRDPITGKPHKNGEILVDTIQTETPLFRSITKGFAGLTPDEAKAMKLPEKKLKGIILEPCPLLCDQLKEHYVLKPEKFYLDLKNKFPNAGKGAYYLFDYIALQATAHKRREIRMNYREMGKRICMDSYIRSRQWSALRKAVTSSYEKALECGLLESFETDRPGKTGGEIDILKINRSYFFPDKGD